MSRAAVHTAESLLDTAEQLVAAGGPQLLTVERLSAASGAPVGSIYHRFRSRSVLAAELWIRAVERFQVELVDELHDPDVELAGVHAALHTLAWSRRHPVAARMLLLYRAVDFVDDDLPEPWSTRVSELNGPLLTALRAYSRRRYGHTKASHARRVGFAVIDIPYGAVHRHLVAGKHLPSDLERLVTTAVQSVLAEGDD
jgi:AcrR family transcriptional regulator